MIVFQSEANEPKKEKKEPRKKKEEKKKPCEIETVATNCGSPDAKATKKPTVCYYFWVVTTRLLFPEI